MAMTQPTPQDEMKAFDRLPKSLRAALAASGEQFSATQILRLWRQRGSSVRELCKMIKAEDRAPPVVARLGPTFGVVQHHRGKPKR